MNGLIARLTVVRACPRRLSSCSRWQVASSHNRSSQKFFSSSNTPDDEFAEWIPPDRPLVGDKGNSHLYQQDDDEKGLEEEIRRLELELEAEEERQAKQAQSNVEEPVDWMQTRRSKQQGVELMSPEEGASKRLQASDVEVIQHTLLTSEEITVCLQAMGGKDIKLLPCTPERKISEGGILLVTGSSVSQILLMADTLVRQLKRRDLAELGVVGAKFGAEGSDDKLDTWRIVDCLNYVVHILDAATREQLNLEALWSGKDPVFNVNPQNEDEVDDYVAANPIPDGYSALYATDLRSSISQMERNNWIIPHRPVVKKPKRKKKRRRR